MVCGLCFRIIDELTTLLFNIFKVYVSSQRKFCLSCCIEFISRKKKESRKAKKKKKKKPKGEKLVDLPVQKAPIH